MVSTVGEPAFEIASLFPDQGSWTDNEYLRLTEFTRKLVELNDGVVEVLPMPTEEHQLILGRLSDIFRQYARKIGGIAIFSAFRLQLKRGKFREPDLLFIKSANDTRRSNAFWTGADLVIEVLSPDDPERDKVTKRKEYAEAAIPEYWIVDPEKQEILILKNLGNEYIEAGIYSGDQYVLSPLLAELAFAAKEIFTDIE